MRPLSQVDPWNGCEVCRRQVELGVMPRHDWTHEFQMWWNDKVKSCARGAEPSEPSAIGTSSTVLGLAGVALALAPLADKIRKEEATDAK